MDPDNLSLQSGERQENPPDEIEQGENSSLPTANEEVDILIYFLHCFVFTE